MIETLAPEIVASTELMEEATNVATLENLAAILNMTEKAGMDPQKVLERILG